jgi:hypothetical protein
MHFSLDTRPFLRYKKCTNLNALMSSGDAMDQPAAPASTAWPFPLPSQDWVQTPTAVHAYLRTVQQDLAELRQRVETLETRLNQNSTTSHRPPSSDSPDKKPRQRSAQATSRNAGGKPGHAGHRQVLLPPTTVHELTPARLRVYCCSGSTSGCSFASGALRQPGKRSPLVWCGLG